MLGQTALIERIHTAYYVLFHLLAAIIFLPWIVRSETFGSIVNADGINRVWW